MSTPKEFPLANIKLVEIITEEDNPETYTLTDVYTEADATAFISEGREEELRVKNVIKAQNKTEDIVKGYDLRLLSVTLLPEILALIDGGEWDAVNKKYKAPVVGIPVERTSFTINVITEEKDIDGSSINFIKFIFRHCTGKPTNYIFKDGEFFLPELTAKSRPKAEESPVEFEVEKDILITLEYAAEDGDITNIDPNTIDFANNKFTLSLAIDEFTFDQESTPMKAKKGKGHWVITEAE